MDDNDTYNNPEFEGPETDPREAELGDREALIVITERAKTMARKALHEIRGWGLAEVNAASMTGLEIHEDGLLVDSTYMVPVTVHFSSDAFGEESITVHVPFEPVVVSEGPSNTIWN